MYVSINELERNPSHMCIVDSLTVMEPAGQGPVVPAESEGLKYSSPIKHTDGLGGAGGNFIFGIVFQLLSWNCVDSGGPLGGGI